MTDRINMLTVFLRKDYRDDDIERLTDAIFMLKGVMEVKTNVADRDSFMAYSRAKADLRDKILEILLEDKS